jgi:hypothetical protein
VLNKAVEFTIRGTIDWCKLLGEARPYTGDPKFNKGPTWSVEINPNEESRKKLAEYGLDEKLKMDKAKKKDGTPTKNPRSYDYLRLTILENLPSGKKMKQPEVKDASGALWNQETEIGNGSVADILVRYVDYGTTKGLYFKKMRVLKLVPYEGGTDFEPLSEDDEFFASSENDVDNEPGSGELMTNGLDDIPE